MDTRQDPDSYPEKKQLLLDIKDDHKAEVVLLEDGLLLKSELPNYYKQKNVTNVTKCYQNVTS